MSSSWKIDIEGCEVGDFVTITTFEDKMKFTGLLEDVNLDYLKIDGCGFPLESVEDIQPA